MSDYVMTSFKACMPHACMIRRRHHSNPTCPRKKELIGVHASFGWKFIWSENSIKSLYSSTEGVIHLYLINGCYYYSYLNYWIKIQHISIGRVYRSFHPPSSRSLTWRRNRRPTVPLTFAVAQVSGLGKVLGLGARESVMAQGSEKNVMTRGPTNRTWWKPAAGPAAEQEQPLHAMAHALPESCLDVAVAFGFLRPAQTRQPGPVPLAPCRPRLVPWIMMHVMWRSAQELSRAPRLSTMAL